jgi:hypothetical protein
MKTQIGQLLVIAGVIGLAGCGLEATRMCLEEGGITYEMPAQKQMRPSPPSLEILHGTDGTSKTNNFGFTFFGEKHTIKELDGNLTINGKDYGKVRTGDQVHIDQSGNVTVNGTPRPPK